MSHEVASGRGRGAASHEVASRRGRGACLRRAGVAAARSARMLVAPCVPGCCGFLGPLAWTCLPCVSSAGLLQRLRAGGPSASGARLALRFSCSMYVICQVTHRHARLCTSAVPACFDSIYATHTFFHLTSGPPAPAQKRRKPAAFRVPRVVGSRSDAGTSAPTQHSQRLQPPAASI